MDDAVTLLATPDVMHADQTFDESETHAAEHASAGGESGDARRAMPPAPSQLIEALLFASDAPLSAARLGDLAGIESTKAVKACIEELNAKYAAAGLSFRIEEIARGYQMLTLPAYHAVLHKLNKQRDETRLSEAALEALAVIAYKQPIIRADVESIRGVACGDVMNRLRDMGLIRVVGRAEVVGRPLLYGTTKKFLDVFGLADLADLPPMEALSLRAKAKVAELSEAPAAAPPSEAAPQAVAGA
jgi:segregation and condensation protein B